MSLSAHCELWSFARYFRLHNVIDIVSRPNSMHLTTSFTYTIQKPIELFSIFRYLHNICTAAPRPDRKLKHISADTTWNAITLAITKMPMCWRVTDILYADNLPCRESEILGANWLNNESKGDSKCNANKTQNLERAIEKRRPKRPKSRAVARRRTKPMLSGSTRREKN